MHFRYGSYRHDDFETDLVRYEVIPEYSQRGFRKEETHRLHISGELKATGTDLVNKINELIAAYQFDGKDAGLFFSDGNPTPHFIATNALDNLTGNRIAYRSWPVGRPAELVNTRKYYIIIEAIFLRGASPFQFLENLHFHGSGGRDLIVANGTTGVPIVHIGNLFTFQEVIQEGVVITPTDTANLYVPSPIWPIWEKHPRRLISQLSPKSRGQRLSEFGMRWRYVFRSPLPLLGQRNTL